eukprot:2805035-Amphidinium_carterae.1
MHTVENGGALEPYAICDRGASTHCSLSRIQESALQLALEYTNAIFASRFYLTHSGINCLARFHRCHNCILAF